MLRLIIALLFSLAIITVLYEYVAPIPEEPVSYLSYFIYGLGALGLIIFYSCHARVKREIACAILSGKQAGALLTDIQNNGYSFNLNDLNTRVGTSNGKLSVNRIIGHIKTEAESRKFDSSLSILHAYKEEFFSMVMRLAGFQKVALHLGILGTFIGLSMAFRHLDIDHPDFQVIVASLKLPFATSIAGLQVSLILWIHLELLQQKQEKLFKELEKCVDLVLNLARHAIYKDSITRELHHVGLKIDEVTGQIEKENELLQHQTKQISEGMSSLKHAGTDLDSFLTTMSQKQADFLKSVQGLYDSLSPGNISQALSEHLSIAVKQTFDAMMLHLDNTLGQYSKLETSITCMHSGLVELKNVIEELSQKNEAQLQSQRELVFKQMGDLLQKQDDYLSQLKSMDINEQLRQSIAAAAQGVSGELQSGIAQLAPSIAQLTSAMNMHNQLLSRQLKKKNLLLRIFSRNGKTYQTETFTAQ